MRVLAVDATGQFAGRVVPALVGVGERGTDLDGGTFELATGGTVTRTEIAAIMTRHAGRTLVAEDIDPEPALGGMPAGGMRDGLVAMFRDCTAYGFRGGNNLVRTILGRPPRTVEDYIAELAVAPVLAASVLAAQT